MTRLEQYDFVLANGGHVYAHIGNRTLDFTGKKWIGKFRHTSSGGLEYFDKKKWVGLGHPQMTATVPKGVTWPSRP